ncbi:unnamed protein product [Zymoseptoria tritici ST99CH_1A5]|uniref:FAD-binding PCMH-type domain-containing protein n=3 Tax=Zymoseptoria tritici TaxID=1047171 RepID=A0A1X7RYU6_ZYMT9|nr:unnamed protein product [Zymoseptoria tritici ST99CH_3D7]SMR57574.1 unnamed protein product [Zymoseptoria tritici ST99CH_3D1]SMY26010.1 unnamed protein product [Zymoseptoria tritici ST99CH_1A5]
MKWKDAGIFARLMQTVLKGEDVSSCRCFPGDSCWPTPQDWAIFNSSVGGRLVATVPLAAPCHHSSFAPYDAAACSRLQEEWTSPHIHYTSSSSVMAPYYANASCDPFLSAESPCVFGTYSRYAVAVHSPADAIRTIQFAHDRDIRLVIRNTGHDWSGKSTGAGSLAIWTHHLKDINVCDYVSPQYTGKAMKMGAGVQAFEAYAAAHASNVVVLGGECPTVGLAGGYTQGGGHSALSSRFGLAADQILQWEVIDGTGRYLIATRDNDQQDLYWALSGGGGGTYGAVLSMTVKAHPEMHTTGAKLKFSRQGTSAGRYWQAVEGYHQTLPDIVDAGIVSIAQFDKDSFAINPITAPGVTESRVRELLSPLVSKLEALGIGYELDVRQFPTYFDHVQAMFSPIGTASFQYGSRLIPRASIAENNSALTQAFVKAAEDGCSFFSVALNASRPGEEAFNSVSPVWRSTLLHAVIQVAWDPLAPWTAMERRAAMITSEYVREFEAVAPDGGAYINEADPRDPNFKQNYYGGNYDLLLRIKDKYDPFQVFYALTGVGSHRQYVRPDGRLCSRTQDP